jgi:excinuclease UvrABC nuclease subunit
MNRVSEHGGIDALLELQQSLSLSALPDHIECFDNSNLQGTNAVEAKKIIDESGLRVLSAIQLQEAADKVKEVLA